MAYRIRQKNAWAYFSVFLKIRALGSDIVKLNEFRRQIDNYPYGYLDPIWVISNRRLLSHCIMLGHERARKYIHEISTQTPMSRQEALRIYREGAS